MKMKCEIIALIFASVVCHHFVSTSVNSNKREEDITTIFIKLYSRFDYLIDKVDKLEENSLTANIAIEKLVQQNQKFEDNFKKIEKFEDNFKKIEERFEKIENHLLKLEKCEENIKKIATFEAHLIKIQKSLNACDPNPCLNGGRCELLSTGSAYKCTNCPVYADGKNCENIKCDLSNKCYRLNDTVHVAFETNVTWEEANRKCESERMTLAKPKDKVSTLSLVNQMGHTYNKDVSKKRTVFWLGLKYDEDRKQWRWTDGSELGWYTGDCYDCFKSQASGQCGVLITDSGAYWFNFDCMKSTKIPSSPFDFYALCEKRISLG